MRFIYMLGIVGSPIALAIGILAGTGHLAIH